MAQHARRSQKETDRHSAKRELHTAAKTRLEDLIIHYNVAYRACSLCAPVDLLHVLACTALPLLALAVVGPAQMLSLPYAIVAGPAERAHTHGPSYTLTSTPHTSSHTGPPGPALTPRPAGRRWPPWAVRWTLRSATWTAWAAGCTGPQDAEMEVAAVCAGGGSTAAAVRRRSSTATVCTGGGGAAAATGRRGSTGPGPGRRVGV